MPELPEVEAAKRLLERGCVGKRIEKAVVASDDKVFDGASPDNVRRALEGRRVVAAHRKGKYLWLELDNPEGPWPLLHFGMTGGIVVQKMGVTKYKRIHLESDPEEWPPRFTKLELDLEGGAKLAFVDARRFARVKLLVDPPNQEPLSKLGFDVLDELPSVEQFAAAVRKRVARAPGLKIKALLLDQEFCSGIGNWVGDEVLYHARIHPEQTVASLDNTALAALHSAICSVVRLAVEVEADSDRFPRDWIFHYRWTNKKPSSVNGHRIEFVTVGSRTSAFVPALQKLTANGVISGGSDGGGGKARAKTKAGGASGRSKRGRGSSKKAASSESEEEEEEEGEEEEEAEEEEEEEEAEEEEEGDSGEAKVAVAKRSRKAATKPPGVEKEKGPKTGKRGSKKAGGNKAAYSETEDEEDDEEDSETEEAPEKKRPRATKAAALAAKKASGSAAAKGGRKRSAAARGRKAKA